MSRCQARQSCIGKYRARQYVQRRSPSRSPGPGSQPSGYERGWAAGKRQHGILLQRNTKFATHASGARPSNAARDRFTAINECHRAQASANSVDPINARMPSCSSTCARCATFQIFVLPCHHVLLSARFQYVTRLWQALVVVPPREGAERRRARKNEETRGGSA